MGRGNLTDGKGEHAPRCTGSALDVGNIAGDGQVKRCCPSVFKADLQDEFASANRGEVNYLKAQREFVPRRLEGATAAPWNAQALLASERGLCEVYVARQGFLLRCANIREN